MQTLPDYTPQLRELITLLSRRDSIPQWQVALIGAATGAVLALGVQIAMRWYDARQTRNDMLLSIYKELAGNFQTLVGILHTIKTNKSISGTTGFLNDVHVARAKFDEGKKERQYDQINGTSGIERAYMNFHKLRGLANDPAHLEIAESIIFQLEQDLFTGNLDLRLFTRFVDVRLASRLKRRETTEEFWRVTSTEFGPVPFLGG